MLTHNRSRNIKSWIFDGIPPGRGPAPSIFLWVRPTLVIARFRSSFCEIPNLQSLNVSLCVAFHSCPDTRITSTHPPQCRQTLYIYSSTNCIGFHHLRQSTNPHHSSCHDSDVCPTLWAPTRTESRSIHCATHIVAYIPSNEFLICQGGPCRSSAVRGWVGSQNVCV